MSQKTKRFDGRDSPMMAFLEKQGVDFSRQDHASYKLKSEGFMDLTVETWVENPGTPIAIMKISVCHYGEQNGDMMRDPEVVYRLGLQSSIEIPESFKNDYTGTFSEVYPVINGTVMIDPAMLQDIKEFTRIWAKNLKQQGHTLMSEKQNE